MAARLRGLTAVLLSITSALACVQDDGSRFNPFSTKVSVEQERAFGFEVDQAILEHLTLVDDPVVLGFVNDLGQVLLEHLEPQPFVYRFRVIEDPSLNAFAVAGGYIYMHTGTLLSAGSLDEFAGVLAHEIGHTKGHHWARMKEKTAVQNIVTQIAGFAAAIATGEPGVAVAAQGVNVAFQLRFSREFEAEADQLAVTFMTRSGLRPAGLARFFEHLILVRDQHAFAIPPYLYSHPDVELRIQAVNDASDRIRRGRGARPSLDRAFRAVQARLALLTRGGRSTLIAASDYDRAHSDPLLEEATRLREAGDLSGAIVTLRRAEALEPADPRTPFRLGELLESDRRPDEAIAAYRRTLALDPTRARVYYQVGRLYASAGDRHQAVFYLEQAARRAGSRSQLRQRAERTIERLTFPVFEAAGLADGQAQEHADTVAGFSREAFGPGDPMAVWWGKVAHRFRGRDETMVARWVDPEGEVVQEHPVEPAEDDHVTSTLEPPAFDTRHTGTWLVEVLLDDLVVDHRSFRVGPPRQ